MATYLNKTGLSCSASMLLQSVEGISGMSLVKLRHSSGEQSTSSSFNSNNNNNSNFVYRG